MTAKLNQSGRLAEAVRLAQVTEITRALKEASGSVATAAVALGVSTRHLYYLIDALGLRVAAGLDPGS